MNFSEQLDKFVARGIKKHAVTYDNEMYREIADTSFYLGCNSLKPIVMKLYDVVKLFKDKELRAWEIEVIAMEALAEIERMIGGEK